MGEPSYLSVLLEEHRSLRASVLEATRNTYTALQWGSAAIAVLAAAALTQWRVHDAAVELVFLLVIPFVSSMSMFLWLGELARIRRVADYLCALELKVALLTRASPERAELAAAWGHELGALEEQLHIALPVSVDPDPLSWERWLKRLRNARAGAAFGHLSWVYRTRAALFPLVAGSSLAIGIYYTASGGVAGHLVESTLMVIVGTLITGAGLWLGLEIGLDLERAAGTRESASTTGVRAYARRVVGKLLNVGDWNGER